MEYQNFDTFVQKKDSHLFSVYKKQSQTIFLLFFIPFLYSLIPFSDYLLIVAIIISKQHFPHHLKINTGQRQVQ